MWLMDILNLHNQGRSTQERSGAGITECYTRSVLVLHLRIFTTAARLCYNPLRSGIG